MGGFFGQGTGPIIADDMNCVGNETSLAACGHRSWYSTNCRHNEDAGVICGGIGLLWISQVAVDLIRLAEIKQLWESLTHVRHS